MDNQEVKDNIQEQKPENKPRFRFLGKKQEEHKEKTEQKKEESSFTKPIKHFYETHYKKLMIITFIILFLAVFQIAHQTITTGDFMHKGVTLKGGITITILNDNLPDSAALKNDLAARFANDEINIKKVAESGVQKGIVIEAGITDEKQQAEFLTLLEEKTKLDRKDFNVEITGSSLGKSFFKEAFTAILIAFAFMGIVVFVIFRTAVPSLAVILCAFSDIVTTLAIVNIMGIKISSSGIIAFLFLIGYSVDSDVLLTTRLLKVKEGSIMDRVYSSIKTGMTMSLTSIAATLVVMIFSRSEVLTQIMLILNIGLFCDLIYTWIQNVGILRLYLEKKNAN